MGCGIEPRNGYFAGAETVNGVEGNMCGAVMRDAVALPGSEATSRTKGSRWNLGGLTLGHRPCSALARIGKARSRSCRGTGEESDGLVVCAGQRVSHGG